MTNSGLWIWLPYQHFAVTTLTIYVMLNWFACDLQILLVDFNWFLHWIIAYWRLLCIILNCDPYRQYGFCFIKASEIIEFKPELKFGYRCAEKESGYGFESYLLVCPVLAFFDLQRHELVWKFGNPSRPHQCILQCIFEFTKFHIIYCKLHFNCSVFCCCLFLVSDPSNSKSCSLCDRCMAMYNSHSLFLELDGLFHNSDFHPTTLACTGWQICSMF